MATHPAEFLEVDEYERVPNLHRSRSGGYVDYLEEQARWDRRDRELQMKRYHDSRYAPQPSKPPDRLYVPSFDTTHRRVRSQEHIIQKGEAPAQSYNVREVRPQMVYDSKNETPHTTELAIQQTGKSLKKPHIKVQIDQPDPPAPVSYKATPRKSLSVSPRSASAVPEVEYRYSTLQHKLVDIGTMCQRSPFIDVEAANPRDLTFAKIAERVKSSAFELQSWNHIVRVEDMARIDTRKADIVDAASKTLGRLIDRVTELNGACGKAKPRDLKLELLPDVDSDEEFKSEDGGDVESERDVTESLGFLIQYHLDSIHIQMQTLKRLARSLQEATPGAKDEVIAVGSLVKEVGKYFGSQETIDRYRIDPRFSGKKALEEARYAVGK